MFTRRILVELVLFAVYAAVVGIAASRLAMGAIAEQSPAEQPRRPAQTRVITIVIEDVLCGDPCAGPMSVDCVTSTNAVSSDMLIVPARDVERLLRGLACQ